MSLPQRESNWLEAAWGNLEEACEHRDWDTARAICQDVEEMAGHAAYAFRRKMNVSMGNKMTPMDVLAAQFDTIHKGLRA